jgi:hypothetical protein
MIRLNEKAFYQNGKLNGKNQAHQSAAENIEWENRTGERNTCFQAVCDEEKLQNLTGIILLLVRDYNVLLFTLEYFVLFSY